MVNNNSAKNSGQNRNLDKNLNQFEKAKPSLFWPVFAAVFLILAVVIFWHLLFPIAGAAVVITGAAWGAIITTVVIFCISIGLFFLLSSLGIFILGLLSILWVIIAIVLFPLLFPIFAPIIIIWMLLWYLFARKNRK